jgi:putative redox protein
MQAKISWAGGVSFTAESGSGHKVTVDGPPNLGGENLGARPMELILMGLGGCAAFDVMTILKKTRQDVTDCVAQLTAERAWKLRQPKRRYVS